MLGGMTFRILRTRAAGIVPVMLALLLGVGGGAAGAADKRVPLPVPRVTIYPGDMIADDLLEARVFKSRRLGRLPVFRSRGALVGKVARRTLLPGRPILVTAVRAPYVVRQGKSALVLFRSGALSISSYATALGSGRPGDVISMRNIDSGLIFQGTVAADGTIRVGTP